MTIIPFPRSPTIEISGPTNTDEFLVAVNDSDEPDGGTIWWNGPSHEEARQVACELVDDFGGRIVDLT